MTDQIDDNDGDDLDLDDVDREALERALEIAMKKDPGSRQQIESMLAIDPWFEVAQFASYSCQCDALHLKPWQSPPCWIDDVEGTLAAGDDDVGGDFAAAKLLKRMLALGISEYEPNPLGALEEMQKPP